MRFANFDFCLLVAIRPSLRVNDSITCCTATSPTIRQGNRRGEAAV